MKIKKCFLAIVVMLALFSQANATNLILNGSFESGINPGSFIQINAINNTSIDNWTVLNGSIDYIGSYWIASDGSRSIDLSGGNVGVLRISSQMTTIVGTSYLVEFDMAGNPAGGPTVKTMDVTAGTVTQAFSFNTSGKNLSNMGWERKSFTFIANNVATYLTFSSTTGTCYGPALDNVSVTVIPEPGTLLLLASGLLGIGISARIRRKK
jgi:choice-of-anchor C domain-containing protein